MNPHLPTERAGVFAVLRDFHLLDHLPERGTITGAIFTGDSNLLCTLGLSNFDLILKYLR